MCRWRSRGGSRRARSSRRPRRRRPRRRTSSGRACCTPSCSPPPGSAVGPPLAPFSPMSLLGPTTRSPHDALQVVAAPREVHLQRRRCGALLSASVLAAYGMQHVGLPLTALRTCSGTHCAGEAGEGAGGGGHPAQCCEARAAGAEGAAPKPQLSRSCDSLKWGTVWFWQLSHRLSCQRMDAPKGSCRDDTGIIAPQDFSTCTVRSGIGALVASGV